MTKSEQAGENPRSKIPQVRVRIADVVITVGVNSFLLKEFRQNLNQLTTVYEPLSVQQALVATKLAPSLGAASRLLEQNGVKLNFERCTNGKTMLERTGDMYVLHAGKKAVAFLEVTWPDVDVD